MARFVPLIIALIVLVTALNWPRSELTSKTYIDRIYSASGQVDTSAVKAVWNNKDIPVPTREIYQAVLTVPTNILGSSTAEKWIDIDLTAQRLVAHEGSSVVYDFPISSGLPWTPTVTGEFYIWAKLLSQRMTGPGYDLPNVPFVQYFYEGYAIHGAYWHANWGTPISHGCVNMKIADAQVLFYWTNPILDPNKYSNTKIQPPQSTRVVVHGTTPNV